MSVNKLKIVAGIAIPDSKYDPGLLYASAVLHDLGLVPHYSSSNLRLEMGGATAARDFLKNHGVPKNNYSSFGIQLHYTPLLVPVVFSKNIEKDVPFPVIHSLLNQPLIF